MKRIIIGTAGHIDHGKTAMIQALTGVDTDRLKEEKKRGISIELGFAGFDIPGIGKVGVVDVPGHEKFIKNMLAGATGIDLVLFVVAADESVMPQTVEHLDILNLLNVKKGIIVLTKVDLIDDEEWVELVEEEVRSKVSGTFLEDSPIIPFSAISGVGREALLEKIKEITDQIESKDSSGIVRLPIDRVFTIKGFGTVITGTLWSGEIHIGDILELQPGGAEVRVRTLQVHDNPVEVATAGQRTAVGLHGVDKDEVDRGDTLLTPNSLTETYMIDAQLNLLKHTDWTLENRSRIHFHLGTQEVLARIVLLESETLLPGESAFVQFRLESPVVADFKDKFVIRSYSPVYTIGGGVILDPYPPKHKRFRPEVIQHLKTLEQGTPEEIVGEVIAKAGITGIKLKILKKNVELPEEKLVAVIQTLTENQTIIKLDSFLIHAPFYTEIKDKILNQLTDYHEKFPYLLGESKENLKGKLPKQIPGELAENVLEKLASEDVIDLVGHKVKLKSHEITLTDEQQQIKSKIKEILRNAEFMPPSADEISEEFDDRKAAKTVIQSMLESGELKKISSNLIYLDSILEKAETLIVDYLRENKELSISEAKEIIGGASRKYTVPLMEYLDKKGVTTRWGDKRFLSEEF